MISDQQMESVLGHIQQAKYLLRQVDTERLSMNSVSREQLDFWQGVDKVFLLSSQRLMKED